MKVPNIKFMVSNGWSTTNLVQY